MRFQMISDLHLEMGFNVKSMPEIPVKSPVLALLGDIGYPSKPKYEEFLLHQASRFERVYVVAGNHEYYLAEYYQTQKRIQEICDKKENLIFLQERSDIFDGHRIVGTTLWSYIPEDTRQMAEHAMNDYRLAHINTSGPDHHYITERNEKKRRLSADDTVGFFQREKTFIEKEIESARQEGQPVVVLTHHAPSTRRTSAPEHDGSTLNCAFASNLEHMMGSPVKFWGFGHTHYSSDQNIKGTRVASNQLGYVRNGHYETEFSPETVFEV
eukprot:gb/GECH01013425.1/.p1 GENE.gb/GECH01013425.1/~~gb/GECH01013425.1/.p1  ORF type:complete len:269 (+),score=69.16 gb/GECH01013425.1/:1-807(+)